ncbi:MAG: hypothetical protein QXK29_05585 [Candidatus Bathyarchaeia archaeon]
MKKSLKFITLLVSALFIGTASAAVYNYMYIYATPVSVKSSYKVNFYAGGDFAKAGGSITNNRQTVTFAGLEGPNGTLAEYSDTVRICNNDTTAHNIKLEITSRSYGGSAESTLDYIKITIYSSSGGQVDSLQIDPHGDDGGDDFETGSNSLTGNNDWWRVKWDIFWFGNATTNDSVNITLKITVES